MCCSSGVCGPSPDKELIRVAAELKRMAENGVDVKRFNLSQQPVAFVNQAQVRKLLQEKGPDILPVILVEGEVKLTGRYPTTEELVAWTAENVKGDQ
ncbi:MAG: arsenite efflux transporter metallochaperone ArsD [Bacillota bacterium]